MFEFKQIVAAMLFALTVHGSARAETTVPITGIGTRVGAIDTHVDRVTHGEPVVVSVPGVGDAYEIRGIVSGVGWGGLGVVARAKSAHYEYELGFVARWRANGGKNVVVFHHGGSAGVVATARTDRTLGTGNQERFGELLGDQGVGLPTLLDHSTYISMNRRGLLHDGRFGAKYLAGEVAPLTQEEVDAIYLAIGPGYTNPDLAAGAPVPTAIWGDTATFRDVDRALMQVVASVSRQSFRRKLFIGNSAGSVLGNGFNFGCSAFAGSGCTRTGGNHVVPYDRSSPAIFDGFILAGNVYYATSDNVDAEQPLAAPTFMMQSRADERYQQPIRIAAELAQKGVKLDGNVWIYELANSPHISRDGAAVKPPFDQGEALAPYTSAAIANLRELLDNGVAPPRSRIAGRIADGQLVFDVVGGTTVEMPVREDLALDSIEAGPTLVVRTVDAAATARWNTVTAALPHDNREIVGPTLACRVGSYRIRFVGALLTPFSPGELAARFGSFAGYRACVSANLQTLESERRYDARVESAADFAARARTLFAE